MKKLVKIFSIVIIMILIHNSIYLLNVHGKTTDSVKDDYYEEIIDPDTLLEMFVKYIQKGKIDVPSVISFGKDTDDNITITQVLRRGTDEFGNEANSMATSTIVLTDENDNIITRSELIADIRYYNGTSSHVGGKYNLVAAFTAYWDWYYDGGHMGRCTRSTAYLQGATNSGKYVKKLEFYFYETSDLLDERMNIVTTNNPNTYTTYTAWNPYTQYTYLDLFFGRLDAGLQITYNDNTTYDDSENIKQAIIDMDSY